MLTVKNIMTMYLPVLAGSVELGDPLYPTGGVFELDLALYNQSRNANSLLYVAI